MKAQMETNTLGSFLENHDNPRFASVTSDIALAKNAIAFTILMDGIPIIYQGQEQHFGGTEDPNNREALWTSGYATTTNNVGGLYSWIAKVNAMRKTAIKTDSGYVKYQAIPTTPDSRTIALRKGNNGAQIVSSFTNIGASGSGYQVSLGIDFTGFAANTELIEVMSCSSVKTDGSGNLVFTQGPETKVFFPAAKLSGSGICDGGCRSVAVTFNEIVTTSIGQTIKVQVAPFPFRPLQG
jgi:alpha-amylase